MDRGGRLQACLGGQGDALPKGQPRLLGRAVRLHQHYRGAKIARNHCNGIKRDGTQKLQSVLLGQGLASALLEQVDALAAVVSSLVIIKWSIGLLKESGKTLMDFKENTL